MQTIQAAEAHSRFLLILDEVERGVSVRIARDGRTIAEIQPACEKQFDRVEVAKAIEAMKELRKSAARLSIAEILSSRDEGRA